jgi:L,D-transpeptidase ErfK/SrfK
MRSRPGPSIVLLLSLFGQSVAAVTAAAQPAAAALVGGRVAYEVKAGDTITSIGARFAVARATLIEMNQLTSPNALTVGQPLVIDNTHIAVGHPDVSVTINVAQRLLVFAEGAQVTVYPIAVGRRTWPTAVGAFTIIGKETDPDWDVPLSIQREMAQQGKPVITRMAASPDNPLGRHWIGLSLPSLGIHGTNAPSSVYSFASHGCMRMHPDDVAQLFERVSVGMRGVLIYQPVIVAAIEGRVWIEAHPDEYRRAPDAARTVRDAIEREGMKENVNWALIDEILRQRRGRAVDVTIDPP